MFKCCPGKNISKAFTTFYETPHHKRGRICGAEDFSGFPKLRGDGGNFIFLHLKLLLINQAFHPDPAATGQCLADFAAYLAVHGHEVTVLTARRGYSVPHPDYPANENFKGVKVIRVWPFHFSRKNRLLRILDALCLNASFAWMLFWLGRYDVVVGLTSPPLVGWVAMLFAKSRASRFVYWMMDMNPDEAIAAGWLAKDSGKARLLEGALRQTLKGSNQIIVLDRFMKDRLVLKGAEASKIEIIPPWAHDEDLESLPNKKNPFREKNALKGKFSVMYSGNLSLCHPLNTLLAAARLLKEDSSVHFLFIGGGDRVADVHAAKEREGLENVAYLPYQDCSEIKYSLNAADLHAVVMGDSFVGLVHPSKIYNILAIGRPFVYVGPAQSAIGEIIETHKIGYQILHGEAERLVEIIRELQKQNESEKQTMQQKIQSAAKEFSKEKICSKLAELIT